MKLEEFLSRIQEKGLSLSEISTTFRRLIDFDPTLMDNLEEGIKQYNLDHPSKEIPIETVHFLLEQVTELRGDPQMTGNEPLQDSEKTRMLDDSSASEPEPEAQQGGLDKTIISPHIKDHPGTAESSETSQKNSASSEGSFPTGGHKYTGSQRSTLYGTQATSTDDHMMIDLTDSGNQDIDVDVGSTISGRYNIIAKLGEGGMGLVFKARDELMAMAQDRNPYVAVKVLTKAFRQRQDAFIALQRETSKAQRLAHPNICTVFHFDKDGDIIFMTMELLNGTDLREYINENIKKTGKPYSWDRAWLFLKGIADALNYAHANNLTHSDLKPGNVYVVKNEKTGEETVKVIDFGIAQAIKPVGDSANATGEKTKFDPKKLGALTPSYATVEMFNGLAPIQTDDIYALGCIAYELLTGSRPYGRLTAKKAEKQGIKAPTVSLKNLGLTRRQERGLIKSVSLYRKDRSKTIEEFMNDVAPRKSYTWQIISGTAAALVLAGALLIPTIQSFFQEKRNEEISALLQSGETISFIDGLEQLLAYENIPERSKVSNLNRAIIQNTIADISTTWFNPKEDRYDYQIALEIAQKGLELFPDSNNLLDLLKSMRYQLNFKNSQLGSILTTTLQKRKLLPTEDESSAVGVLTLALKLDPNNSLLRDPSLRFVFKEQILAKIKGKQYDEAQSLITYSAQLILDAKTMPLYTADQLALARNRVKNEKLRAEILKLISQADKLDLAKQKSASLAEYFPLAHILARANSSLIRAQTNNDQRFNQLVDDLGGAKKREAFISYAGLTSLENLSQQKLRTLSAQPEKLTEEQEKELNKLMQIYQTLLQDFSKKSVEVSWLAAFDLHLQKTIAYYGDATKLRSFLQANTKDINAQFSNLLAQNRYTLAKYLMSHLNSLLPKSFSGSFEHSLASIERQYKQFQQLETRKQALARIESIRQNLVRQLEVKDIKSARKTEKRLRSIMDPRDLFLLEELPDLYANALFSLSYDSVVAGRIKQATSYFAALGKYIKRNDDRYVQIDNYLKGEKLKSKLISQISRSNVIYEQDLRKKFNDLVLLNAYGVDKFLDRLANTIIKRVKKISENSIERAQIMLDVALKAFPDSEILKTFDLDEFIDKPDDEQSQVDDFGAETEAALQVDLSQAGSKDRRANELVAEAQSHLRKRNLTATFVTLDKAKKTFPNNSQLKALDKAYQTERAKAEDIYRQHNSAILRGDFTNAIKLIKSAMGYWRDNKEYKLAATNISKIQEQVKAGARICSDNLSGIGKNPRAFCYDIIKAKKGPRLIIIPGDKRLLKSFVITRGEVKIGEYNLFCKSTRSCRPLRGSSSIPATSLTLKQMDAYAKWLSDNTFYTYRLPTINEWVYAASANNNEDNSDYNCTLKINGNQVKGHEILKADQGVPNRWGLINYVGNVDEVVKASDKYILKGGNHKDPMFRCTVKMEKAYDGQANKLIGFRLVRSLH